MKSPRQRRRAPPIHWNAGAILLLYLFSFPRTLLRLQSSISLKSSVIPLAILFLTIFPSQQPILGQQNFGFYRAPFACQRFHPNMCCAPRIRYSCPQLCARPPTQAQCLNPTQQQQFTATGTQRQAPPPNLAAGLSGTPSSSLLQLPWMLMQQLQKPPAVEGPNFPTTLGGLSGALGQMLMPSGQIVNPPPFPSPSAAGQVNPNPPPYPSSSAGQQVNPPPPPYPESSFQVGYTNNIPDQGRRRVNTEGTDRSGGGGILPASNLPTTDGGQQTASAFGGTWDENGPTHGGGTIFGSGGNRPQGSAVAPPPPPYGIVLPPPGTPGALGPPVSISSSEAAAESSIDEAGPADESEYASSQGKSSPFIPTAPPMPPPGPPGTPGAGAAIADGGGMVEVAPAVPDYGSAAGGGDESASVFPTLIPPNPSSAGGAIPSGQSSQGTAAELQGSSDNVGTAPNNLGGRPNVNNNGGGETAFRASNGAIDGTVKVGEDASKRRNASSKRDRAIKPPTTATKGGDDSVEVMSSSSGGGGPTLHGAQDLVVSSVGEGGGDGTGEGGRVSSSPPQQPQQKAVVDAGGLMVNVPPTPMPPESTWKPISFNVRKSLGQQQPQEEATRTTVSEVFAITDETTPAAAASMMMALHRSASPNEWLNFRIQPAGAHRTNPGVMQGSSRDLPIPPMDGSVKHSITSAGHNESLLNASGGRRKEILGEKLDVLIDRNVLQALHSFSAELKKKKNAASAAASNGGQSPQGIPEAKALNTTQQQPIPTTAAEIYGTTVGTTTTTMMMMMTTKATTTFAPRPSQPQPQCNSPPDFHPCVSLPEANQRLADCCRRKALPPGCLPLCRYDITQLEIKTAFERGHCGLFNILPYLECASQGVNNVDCCRRREVAKKSAPHCEVFCNPSGGIGALGLQHLVCQNVLQDYLQCHHIGLKPT